MIQKSYYKIYGEYFNKLDFHQYLNLCRRSIVFEQEDISLKLAKLTKFMVILQKLNLASNIHAPLIYP